MKASFITMHSVYNYGSQLQTLATQEKLKDFFDEVEIIDYRRKDTYGFGLIKSFAKGNPIRSIAFMPTYFKWMNIFPSFQKKYLNVTKKKYLKDSDFDNYEEDSDIYITGSDQVWNTGWNNGILPPYYLSFVKSKPKFAYSASFGLDKLDNKDIDIVKEYLSKYKKISVREESGLKIINNQLKLNNAINVIDPTLVMDKKFWDKYSTNRKINEKYILVYNLNNNPDFDNYAKKLEEKTGIKVYRFCTRYDQIRKYGKSLIIPKVLDFISLIEGAEYVLTDSFHATAFSINMHTHPICIYPKKYSNRISDFLRLVGCEDACKVKNYNDFSILNTKIDFENTDKILNKERKKVDEFLKQIKKEI